MLIQPDKEIFSPLLFDIALEPLTTKKIEGK